MLISSTLLDLCVTAVLFLRVLILILLIPSPPVKRMAATGRPALDTLPEVGLVPPGPSYAVWHLTLVSLTSVPLKWGVTLDLLHRWLLWTFLLWVYNFIPLFMALFTFSWQFGLWCSRFKMPTLSPLGQWRGWQGVLWPLQLDSYFMSQLVGSYPWLTKSFHRDRYFYRGLFHGGMKQYGI